MAAEDVLILALNSAAPYFVVPATDVSAIGQMIVDVLALPANETLPEFSINVRRATRDDGV